MVTWFFRKPRPNCNYSIERSFNAIHGYFTSAGFVQPRWYEVSHLSKGVVQRIKIIYEVWKNKDFINHITGDIHFATLALPYKRTILTIHDCGFLEKKKWIRSLVLKYFWLTLPVKKAKYITAVSEETKRQILKHTNCSPSRITVIPSVIKETFSYKYKPFNNSKPRILHIGTAYNKNLEAHIKALEGIPCKLCIIGKIKDYHVKVIEECNIDYENKYNLSDSQIVSEYEASDMLIFASTYEGFGMPILEAQAVGRAVVTSNLSSMPEVAGNAACMVNPFDIMSIRDGVNKIINDDEYRNTLIENGLKNIKRFSNSSVAQKYINLYLCIQKDLSQSSNDEVLPKNWTVH